MATFDNLPCFALTLLSEKFNFDDFANAFNVWRHRKDLKTQHHVLSDTDLIPYFLSAGWNPQFLPFIHYASQVQVLDAFFYTPCYILFHDRQHVKHAAMMMKQVAEEGHLMSKFTYSLYSIFHIPELKEEGMQNLLHIVGNARMTENIPNWVSFLQSFRRSWNPIQFDFPKLGSICTQPDVKKSHFSSKSWPVLFQDLEKITCNKCKVSIVLFNFCNGA